MNLSAQNQGLSKKGDISVWFQTFHSDSTNEVQVVPTLLNKGTEPVFLYYSSIYGGKKLTIRNATHEQKGLVALMPGDTSIVYLTCNPILIDSNEKNIRFFLSENEFVFLEAEWASKKVQIEDKKEVQIVDIPKSKPTTQSKPIPAKPKPKKPLQGIDSQKLTETSDKIKTQKEQAIAAHKNKSKNTTQPFLAKDDFEIAGLIFNETRTRFGAEFYRKLNEIWTPPQKVGSYWITIRELPSPGRFTILSVNLNNRELFQRNLIPRGNYIESLAYQTANLLNSVLKQGNYDGSLSNTDLFGSGIE